MTSIRRLGPACALAALSSFLSPLALGGPPEYDVVAYCAETAKQFGQSYFVEKSCRDQEERARADLVAREIEPRIEAHCAETAELMGRSYWIFSLCVDQEEGARDALK